MDKVYIDNTQYKEKLIVKKVATEHTKKVYRITGAISISPCNAERNVQFSSRDLGRKSE